MLSRRALVGKLAAGAAVAWTSNIGAAKTASAHGGLNPRVDYAGGEAIDLPVAAEARGDQADRGTYQVSATVNDSAPWELLTPLTTGSVVAHGWHVAGLSSVMDGSCVLTLQNDRGRNHRIHLCRNNGSPQGLVYTDQLDLVVMNGGQGDLPTDESLAQAIAEVAHVLAVNEDKRQQRPVVVALMPHTERLRLFADSADARLR